MLFRSPIYNVETYLERCIRSIVNQTYSELEIILVDDGSTDLSSAICDKWEKKDFRINVIHKENGGLSDARNAGMKIATGKYITFIDSDDWMHKDMIKILYNVREKFDVDIVECKSKKVDNFIDDVEIEDDIGVIQLFNDSEAISALLLENPLKQTVWNKLYKKELIEGTYFEFGKYHEDEFWTYQVLAKSKKIGFVDKELYYYFQRYNSIMSQTFSLKRIDAIEGRYRRMNFIREFYPENTANAKITLFYLILFYGQQALKCGDKITISVYFLKMKKYMLDIEFSKEELQEMSLLRRLWIKIGTKNIQFVCLLRNLINVGTC